MKQTEAEYTELMRQKLEKGLHRRAKELGFEVVKKAESEAPMLSA